MSDRPNWADSFKGGAAYAKPPSFRGDFGALRPPRGIAGIKCQPKQSIITDKHAIVKLLARYLPAGEGGSTGSKTFAPLVYTPSNRLRLAIQMVFEADSPNQKDVVLQAGNEPTWSIQGMSRNPETGRETALQLAYPSTGTKNLPDGAEFDTAATLLRPNITLKDTNFSTSYVAATERVNALLICTWEPNIEIPFEELQKLYAQCSVGWGQPTLITNSAA